VNAGLALVPWPKWLGERGGRLLLDLWCGGLIGFVALLVVAGGSTFALLVFLAAPFIAVVQVGWRRIAWLGALAATCSAIAALGPVSAGATGLRLGLVGAAVAVALAVARTIRRESAASRDAAARAELERTLAREAHHRIKNDLQTAADLLLLARPAGDEGAAFDETAARIRSIATVHRLLTEAEADDGVEGAALLASITAATPYPLTIDAQPGTFTHATAQKLGIVANELIVNAFRHGAPPIAVRLERGNQTRLYVDDHGRDTEYGAGGFGLDLVRQLVEQGLGGRFELQTRPGGGTRAEVVFPTVLR
jgi:two-component sensor histidine kinase